MSINRIRSYVFIIIAIVILSACDFPTSKPTTASDVQVIETSSNTKTVSETIHINNCGNPGAVEQTAEHSFASNIEGAVGAEYHVFLEAKYGQYRTVTKRHTMTALPNTNMEYVLAWTEQTFTGSITANNQGGKYDIRVPISVEQISSHDLGNCPGSQASNTPIQPLPAPTNAPISSNPTPIINSLPGGVCPVLLINGADQSLRWKDLLKSWQSEEPVAYDKNLLCSRTGNSVHVFMGVTNSPLKDLPDQGIMTLDKAAQLMNKYPDRPFIIVPWGP